MHQVEQFARAPVGVCTPKSQELLDDRRIRLPGAAVRPVGVLMKAGLAVLFEPVDPLTLVPRMGMDGLRDMLKRSASSVTEY